MMPQCHSEVRLAGWGTLLPSRHKTSKETIMSLKRFVPLTAALTCTFVAGARSSANAQPLPAPAAFVSWLDLECYRPDPSALNAALNQTVKLTQLNPALSTVRDHQVFAGNLEEFCTPVRKNGVNPPAGVLPFEMYADFACYKVDSQFLLDAPMALQHLNPVLRRMSPLPVERVRVGRPEQLCVPVEKVSPEAPPIPDAVRALIQHLDLECFNIQSDPPSVSPALPIRLGHLNPLFRGLFEERVTTLRPQQLCLPVAKDDRIPPLPQLRIAELVDLKKYAATPLVAPITRPFRVRQLNPLFSNIPEFQIQSLFPQRVALPVRKNTVGVNKDLRNTTGRPANDIEILIEGTPLIAFHYDGYPNHRFSNFTATPQGTNTLLHWSQPNADVAPGEIAHVGFTVVGDVLNILSVGWTFNTAPTGCARQVSTNTHLLGSPGGQVTYTNNVVQCQATPLFVGDLTIEWHAREVDLADLNATSQRTPLRVDRIPAPPAPLEVTQSVTLRLPQAPVGAEFAVLTHTVRSPNDATAPTTDFLEFAVTDGPADNSVPLEGALGKRGFALLGLSLVGGVYALLARTWRKRSRRFSVEQP
jgi:hypothetical protein